jgi:hypothetical protein
MDCSREMKAYERTTLAREKVESGHGGARPRVRLRRLGAWFTRSRAAPRSCLLAALVLLAPASSHAAPDSAALVNALSVAGRQRMLGERIAKAWCLLGLGNENRQPRAQVREAIELYEEYLAELAAFVASHPRIRPGLEDLERRWRPFERLADVEPSRGKAMMLFTAGQNLIEGSERLVRALVALSGRDEAPMLTLADRQRMLGQQLVKAYCYLAWGFDQPLVLDQFVASWNEFESAQAQLRGFPGNTPALDSALDRTTEEWGWFKSALSLYKEDVFYPGIIDHAAENTLSQMDAVTALYLSMLASRSGI